MNLFLVYKQHCHEKKRLYYKYAKKESIHSKTVGPIKVAFKCLKFLN